MQTKYQSFVENYRSIFSFLINELKETNLKIRENLIISNKLIDEHFTDFGNPLNGPVNIIREQLSLEMKKKMDHYVLSAKKEFKETLALNQKRNMISTQILSLAHQIITIVHGKIDFNQTSDCYMETTKKIPNSEIQDLHVILRGRNQSTHFVDQNYNKEVQKTFRELQNLGVFDFDIVNYPYKNYAYNCCKVLNWTDSSDYIIETLIRITDNLPFLKLNSFIYYLTQENSDLRIIENCNEFPEKHLLLVQKTFKTNIFNSLIQTLVHKTSSVPIKDILESKRDLPRPLWLEFAKEVITHLDVSDKAIDSKNKGLLKFEKSIDYT